MALQNVDGALMFATGLDNSGLKTGITQSINMISGLKNRISKINPFVGIGIGAALAFAKALQEATQFELEFRKKMAEVKTISDEVTENYGYFADELNRIASETGESANVLAAGLYQVISASFGAEESIGLLEIAAKAAKAGISDTETSIDAITTVLNAWNLSADKASEVADTFFQTVKAGKTTFGEYGSQVAQVASIAADAGVSFQDISEAVAELTKRGTPTAQALTQIRAGIVSTREVLGDTIFETNNLREAFRLMAENSGGSFSKLKEDAGRIEAVNGILALTSETAEVTAQKYNTFMEELVGATDEAYSRIETISQSSWSKIGNIIMDSIRPLGNATVNWLEKLGEQILNILNLTENATDRINGKIAKNTSKVEALFSVIGSSVASDEAKAAALEQINKQYSRYLDFQLTDKTTSEALAEAKERVLSGVTAEAGIQGVSDAISDLINKYNQEVNRLLDDIRSGIASTSGSEISSLFTTELNNLTKDLGSINEDGTLNEVLPDEGEIAALWNRYIKETGVGFNKFKELVYEVAEERVKLNREIGSLQNDLNEYQEIYSSITGTALTNLSQKDQAPEVEMFDFKAEAQKLDDIKKEFERFKLLQTDASREQYISQSEYLTESLTEWSDYLTKRYEEAKSANEKLLLEMQATSDNINLTMETMPMEAMTPLGVGELEVPGVLESIENELQRLQADLRAATLETEKNEILAQIEALETKKANWLKYKDDVTDIYKDLFNSIETLRNKDLKSLLKKIDKAISEEKDGSENQIELLKRRGEIQDKIVENTKKTFSEIPGIFSELTTLITNIDPGLGSSLEKLQGLVSAGAQLGTSIATGDVFGMVGGGLSVVNSLFSLFDNSAAKQEEMIQKAEIFRQQLKLQNKELERQLELMQSTSGTQRFEAEVDTLDLINSQIDELNKAADDLNLVFKKSERTGLFGWGRRTQTWTLKNFEDVEALIDFIERGEDYYGKDIDYFLDAGFKFENMDDAQQLIDAYDELIAKRKELLEEFLETSTTSIADDIRNGLEEGLEFVDAFAQSFEEAMRGAIMHSFELQYIMPLAEKLYNEIADIMSPQNYEKKKNEFEALKEINNISGDFDAIWAAYVGNSVESIQEKMKDEIEAASSQWDIINQLLEDIGVSEGADKEETLSGTISRSITEETGSELLGLWHVTSLDIRTIRDTFTSLKDLAEESVELLSLINQNTSITAENSAALNSILEEIQNSKNSNRGYGV